MSDSIFIGCEVEWRGSRGTTVKGTIVDISPTKERFMIITQNKRVIWQSISYITLTDKSYRKILSIKNKPVEKVERAELMDLDED